MILPKGVMTALITPFRDGRINAEVYDTDVARQVSSGMNGLVACGTTAETPTLDEKERDWLIRAAVVGADGKIPVVVGTGTNATTTTIEATRHARKLGADAALVVTPYYNRPSQEGLFRHFEAVALRSDLPIILYNVPARTGVDLDVDTVVRLSELKQIAGIKDASADRGRCQAIKQRVHADFRVYSGDDRMAGDAMLSGADGVISVIANAYPVEWRTLCLHALDGEDRKARWMLSVFGDLLDALSLETNPCTIKYLMSLTHQSHSAEVRLPLVPITSETAARIRGGLDLATTRLWETDQGDGETNLLGPEQYTRGWIEDLMLPFRLRRDSSHRGLSQNHRARP
ncbi:4-hydroxy-tetrahydrodipicolinate synthase [Tianweitania sp. BSSL-BM11]|uniref:4-hydroxy-tetrahydrodipicolinate synthase n=1 Tax=Tianweitania aestuarii TaxID=2814886 RepID=A0ABS5RR82_9HYPH|nr:4-hydroxy-tetrahydrodipicolinate synthase [Tianweitania aestuarii]MBS9719563.1 4-hydroxy-tetrahydrodipicolinate synthase [Tianweitania aestuarii]